MYRATSASTGTHVAIKVIRDVSDQSAAQHQARREQAALDALAGHPNVIQLLEPLTLADGPALVMEYASGGSVADLMARRGGTVTAVEAASIGRQVAGALSAAHALGIVHRDVKPHNLLLDTSGHIRLCDFGIASLTRTCEFRDRPRAWSVRYASPEDLEDDAEVGTPSDIYSLGATLLHLVHGAPPSSRDRIAGWKQRPSDDPTRQALDSALAECLLPHPEARPTAKVLADRLGEVCRTHERLRRGSVPAVRRAWIASPVDRSLCRDPDETLHHVRRRPPRGVSSPRRSRRRRTPVLVGLVAAAVIGLLGTGAWAWARGGPFPATRTSVVEATFPFALSTPPPNRPSGSIAAEPAQTTDPSPGIITSDSPLGYAERPVGLVGIDDPSITWPFGEIGGCLVQLAGYSDLQPVPCDEPHDLQRFAVGVLDPAEYPTGMRYDEFAVQAAVEAACASKLASFTGSGHSGSALDVPVTRPSAASWTNGDRRFQCLLGVSNRRVIRDAIENPAPWAS